jgi:hypothetical protein
MTEVFVVGKNIQEARSTHIVTITSEKIYEKISPPFFQRVVILFFTIGISDKQ